MSPEKFRFYGYLYIVMRRLSIILLFLYLCSTTELYQFLKIPILIEHYLTHRATDPDMGICDFLKLHYDNHVKDTDWQEDERLPFMVHQDILSVMCTVPECTQEELSPAIRPRISSTPHHRSLFHLTEIVDTIWQPPQCC